MEYSCHGTDKRKESNALTSGRGDCVPGTIACACVCAQLVKGDGSTVSDWEASPAVAALVKQREVGPI